MAGGAVLRCYACSGLLPTESFAIDRKKPGGRKSICLPCDREKARAYYRENRERLLARAATQREPRPPAFCSECGAPLEGQQRVTCGSAGCRDRRFRRLHPAEYLERERRKVERRREKRREAAGS